MTTVYLDASALVKTLVRESETDALRSYLASQERRVTSRVATIEIPRAVARKQLQEPTATTIESGLGALALIELTEEIAAAAARVSPPSLRTLDAIHLASALTLGNELVAMVTYDVRLADAARSLGLPVEAPA